MTEPFGLQNQVTLENWLRAPFNRWAFQHVRELIPSARIPRGDGAEGVQVVPAAWLDAPMRRATVAAVLAIAAALVR